MYIITLEITPTFDSYDIQGIKESIAMDLEKYGNVEVVKIDEEN